MSTIDVDVGKELQAQIASMLREALPSVLPKMEEATRELMDAAIAEWPVQDRSRLRPHDRNRGREHSAAMFRMETTVEPDAVSVLIVNDAVNLSGVPYIFFIKPLHGRAAGKSAWVTMIRTPARKRAKALGEELRVELTKLAGK